MRHLQSGGGYGAPSPRLRSFLPGRMLFVAEEMPIIVRLLEVSMLAWQAMHSRTEWKGSMSESQP
jgi:hypothetical protein